MEVYRVFIMSYNPGEEAKYALSEETAREHFRVLKDDLSLHPGIADVTFDNCKELKYTNDVSDCPSWELITVDK